MNGESPVARLLAAAVVAHLVPKMTIFSPRLVRFLRPALFTSVLDAYVEFVLCYEPSVLFFVV